MANPGDRPASAGRSKRKGQLRRGHALARQRSGERRRTCPAVARPCRPASEGGRRTSYRIEGLFGLSMLLVSRPWSLVPRRRSGRPMHDHQTSGTRDRRRETRDDGWRPSGGLEAVLQLASFLRADPRVQRAELWSFPEVFHNCGKRCGKTGREARPGICGARNSAISRGAKVARPAVFKGFSGPQRAGTPLHAELARQKSSPVAVEWV